MTLSTKQKQILLIVASGVLSTVASIVREHYPQYGSVLEPLLPWAGFLLGLPVKLPSGQPQAVAEVTK